jgi:hypothetical protein
LKLLMLPYGPAGPGARRHRVLFFIPFVLVVLFLTASVLLDAFFMR